MSKPSNSHFKPNFKPTTFTAPRWHLGTYLHKIHAHISNHPLYRRLSSSQSKLK